MGEGSTIYKYGSFKRYGSVVFYDSLELDFSPWVLGPKVIGLRCKVSEYNARSQACRAAGLWCS